jgi:type II secretory pathway pseudopilin PulG
VKKRIPYKVYDTGKCGGLTLIEILVSLLLFSVVMIVALGAIVTMIDANRKSRSQKTVGDNVSAALESMTRAIRDGTVYHCDIDEVLDMNIGLEEDCPLGSTVFAFEALGGDPGTATDQVVYKLEGAGIQRSLDGGASFVSLTAPDVVVENLTFRTISYGAADEQPKILIVISGKVGGDSTTETVFSVQTTVSQRFTDLTLLAPDINVGEWPQKPTCPFLPISGRIIVDFEDFAPGYSGHMLFSPTVEIGPFSLLESIPGGVTYKVSATVFDRHCGSGGPPDCNGQGQTDESMYIELLNVNDEVLYTSEANVDIGEEENQPQFVLSDAFWTSGTPPDAVKVKAYHAGPSFDDSVHPGCYAFDSVSEVFEY